MPVVRSVRAALYGGTPCPTAVHDISRGSRRSGQQVAQSESTCKSSVVIGKQLGVDSRRTAPATAYCAESLRKCRDFSRLGGAHRLEEGVDVAYKVAEVCVRPRVLREELAANHLAAHTGGVAPVGVDPGGRQTQRPVGSAIKSEV